MCDRALALLRSTPHHLTTAPRGRPCMRTCKSCETGSLFFSRKLCTEYVTSPAKCLTQNSVGDVFSSSNATVFLRNALHTFCRYDVSEPLGKTHSSVSMASSPCGCPPIKSTTRLLSAYSTRSTERPSASYLRRGTPRREPSVTARAQKSRSESERASERERGGEGGVEQWHAHRLHRLEEHTDEKSLQLLVGEIDAQLFAHVTTDAVCEVSA